MIEPKKKNLLEIYFLIIDIKINSIFLFPNMLGFILNILQIWIELILILIGKKKAKIKIGETMFVHLII